MRDLDLTTLRYLVAVCDAQNIARAAEQEHIAPSAISKRIASLEFMLGVPLLIRTRRGVAQTPACEALLERARTMLFEAAQIESEMNAFGSGLQGQVRLLASPSAIAEQLLDDVASFMREPGNKGIKVNIEEHFTREIPRVLRDGSNGIGICWESTDLRGLQQRPYRSDDLAPPRSSTGARATSSRPTRRGGSVRQLRGRSPTRAGRSACRFTSSRS